MNPLAYLELNGKLACNGNVHALKLALVFFLLLKCGLCGSFGIGLFVSSDTYKGKAAYIRISPDPA